MIDIEQARVFMAEWADRVGGREVDWLALAAGRAAFVGSILFQYETAGRVLIARGVIFSDISALADAQAALDRLQPYALRHPEAVADARLELATAEQTLNPAGRIVLRLDITDTADPPLIYEQLRTLSKNADNWRRRHVMAAMRGDP